MESNDNVERVSMLEVKRCLKEAGSYDSTMSDNEMMELYEVLNDSKNTASKEDEQRRILKQTEINCSMLEELRRNSEPVNSVQNDGDSSTTDDEMFEQKPFKQLQQTKPQEKEPTAVPTKTSQNQNIEPVKNEQVIDVFNSIPTTHRPLKRISLKASYNPPFYCDPKIAKMNNERKAHAIAEYHLKIIHRYENYQRQSIYPAPWGKPIQTALRFNGSLTKKIEKLPEEDADMENNIDPLSDDKDFEEEIYISQSGRQTKRKIYSENAENIHEPKRNKTSTNDTNQTAKKPQTRKRNGTLKNDEIIKRSKLFGDNNATRTEKMFDKIIEDEPKKRSIEKEVEKFQESLNHISDEENIDIESSFDVVDIVHSEEPFIRRRVVPPSQMKKQSASSAAKPAGQGRGRRAINKKGSRENSQELKTQKYESLETPTKTESSSKEEMGTCPMCNLKFPQSELEEHASGCEDSYSERATTTKISDPSIKKMSCECCDQVFPLSMDYEVHVRECLRKSKLKTV